MRKKILILGDKRMGKDTIAEMICGKTDYKFASSSEMALEVFLFDVLNDKYSLGYKTKKDAFNDRVNHRETWFNEICEYNKDDKLRLTKDILKVADIYVGLRSHLEVEAAISQGTFDYIIGVYDYRKPREASESNTADVLQYSDFIVLNNGSLQDLHDKVDDIVLKILAND